MKTFYYKDELTDDFSSVKVNKKKVDSSFKFIHKNLIWRFFSFLIYYLLAIPVAFFHTILFRRVKFVNKKVLKGLKKQKAFFYGNHTGYTLDASIPCLMSFWGRNKILVSPDTVSIFGIKNLVQMVGALPIPSGLNGMKEFVNAIDYYHKNYHITVFPEAHIWPYYTSVRNFSSSSFRYPAKYNAPVVAFCTCYTKPTGLFKNLRKANITVYISEIFYPDKSLSIAENKKLLRDKVYNFMKDTTQKYSTYKVIDYKKLEKK